MNHNWGFVPRMSYMLWFMLITINSVMRFQVQGMSCPFNVPSFHALARARPSTGCPPGRLVGAWEYIKGWLGQILWEGSVAGNLAGDSRCMSHVGPTSNTGPYKAFFVGLVVKITTGVWKFYGCPVAISQLLMVWLRSNQDFCRKVSRESGNKAKDRVYLRLLDADYAKLSNGVR